LVLKTGNASKPQQEILFAASLSVRTCTLPSCLSLAHHGSPGKGRGQKRGAPRRGTSLPSSVPQDHRPTPHGMFRVRQTSAHKFKLEQDASK